MRYTGSLLLILALTLLRGDFLTFERLADGAHVTTQFPDLVFTNATIATAGISLNEFEFPPHSGTGVVIDDGGPISIQFLAPVVSFHWVLYLYGTAHFERLPPRSA